MTCVARFLPQVSPGKGSVTAIDTRPCNLLVAESGVGVPREQRLHGARERQHLPRPSGNAHAVKAASARARHLFTQRDARLLFSGLVEINPLPVGGDPSSPASSSHAHSHTPSSHTVTQLHAHTHTLTYTPYSARPLNSLYTLQPGYLVPGCRTGQDAPCMTEARLLEGLQS